MVLEGSLAAAAAVLCDPGLVCQGLMAVQHKYGVDVATAMALRMQKSIQPDTLRAVEALVSQVHRLGWCWFWSVLSEEVALSAAGNTPSWPARAQCACVLAGDNM